MCSLAFSKLPPRVLMNRTDTQAKLAIHRMIFKTCLLAALGVAVGTPRASLAQSKPELDPLPIAEALSARHFGPGPMSQCPGDPYLIAYQLSDWSRTKRKVSLPGAPSPPAVSRGGEIWLTDTRTGESKSISGDKGSNWLPVWSPNGKFIAFYSDRTGEPGVWLWEHETERLRQLSQVVPRFFLGGVDISLVWSGDSKHLFVKVAPEAVAKASTDNKPVANEVGTIKLSIYESVADPKRASTKAIWGIGELTPDRYQDFTADLAEVDIDSGKLRRVIRNQVMACFWMSPDENSIALLSQKGLKHNDDFMRPDFDLIVISLKDGTAKVLVPGLVQGTLGDLVSWSPDSTRLAYVAVTTAGTGWFIVPASGGAPKRLLSEAKTPSFNYWQQPPLWSPDSESFYALSSEAVWQINASDGSVKEVAKFPGKIVRQVVTTPYDRFWSPASNLLVVVVEDVKTRKASFSLINTQSQQVTSPISDLNVSTAPIQVSVIEGSQEINYVSEDASHSPQIWSVDGTLAHQQRRITCVNQVFDRYVMGEGRMIEWSGGDGRKLRGAVLLPAGYREGQRYPVIVHVYGGAMLSERANMFGYASAFNKPLNMQLWATRGFVVLMPDAPLREGMPMLDLAKTVLPGIDRLIELGIADADRTAIWGGSYGGYSTMALITQTNRFKAAVCDSGFVNLVGLYGWMSDQPAGSQWQGWAEAGQGRMGGSLWQYRDRYIENSPLFYLDRIQTPVLIIQGTEDPGSKDYLSNEIFVNLQRLGKEATYLKYHGASHTIGSFGYEEQVDVVTRLAAWFDKHLRTPKDMSRN